MHDAWPFAIVAPVTVMVGLFATAVTAPAPLGHVDAMLSGETVSTLAGSVSVKPMPDCAGLPAPLVSVKTRVELASRSTVAGENALVSAGCTTSRVALAVPPVSATGPVAVTAPVVLA